MFEKILVPVDLTEKNHVGVAQAARLARLTGGTVTLLHVIETLDLPFEELKDFYKDLEERAEPQMAQLAAPLIEEGFQEVDRVIAYGRRAEEVARYADEHDFDLIVLSSHKIDPENPGLSWATLSYKVAILAQCPVLLVK